MATITVTPVISVPITTRTLSAFKCYDNSQTEPNLVPAFVKTMASLSGSVVFPYTVAEETTSGPSNTTYWTTG